MLLKDVSLETENKSSQKVKIIKEKSCAKFELGASCFKLTDNIFQILAGEIVNLARSLELLNAENGRRFEDTTPLGLAEVLEELSHFAAADELLL